MFVDLLLTRRSLVPLTFSSFSSFPAFSVSFFYYFMRSSVACHHPFCLYVISVDISHCRSLDSADGTVARLQGAPPGVPVREKGFFSFRSFQTGPGDHTASCWRPEAVSLGAQRLVSETDHLPPSSDEVKNAWSYNSSFQYATISCTRNVSNIFCSINNLKFLAYPICPIFMCTEPF
jgi:hypothetical protein